MSARPFSEKCRSLLHTVELLVRRPADLVEQIQDGKGLQELPLKLVAVAATGFGAHGLLLGLTRSPLHGLLASMKLIIVALGALAVCLPALHVYGRALGTGASLLQTCCEALVAVASAGLTLLALAPVWIAYAGWVNTPPNGYFLVMGGSIAFLLFAGGRGAYVVLRALILRRRPNMHLFAWAAVYGLVAIQAAWVVRPFVGNPESRSEGFVFVRPLESSAFDALPILGDSALRAASGRSVPNDLTQFE